MLFRHRWIQGQPSPGPVFTGKHHHCGLHGSQQQGGTSAARLGRDEEGRGQRQQPAQGAVQKLWCWRAVCFLPPCVLYMSDWGLMESWLEKTHFWLLMATVRLQIWSLGLSSLMMRFVCFRGRVALWEEMMENNTSGFCFFFFLAIKHQCANVNSQAWKVTLSL